MRVAIAGAGVVGRSIANDLLAAGHRVLLIERDRRSYQPHLAAEADWMLADACEMGTLQAAGIQTCDVVMAATGDDKANLVFALLAKTQFGVPRVVARINEPGNQWLFTESWGVDVAVSTPDRLVAAVDEAVTVGDVVRLMTLQQGRGNIVTLTLPQDSPMIGIPIGELGLPAGAALLAVLRLRTRITPQPSERLQPGDELMLAVTADAEREMRSVLLAQQ